MTQDVTDRLREWMMTVHRQLIIGPYSARTNHFYSVTTALWGLRKHRH